MTSSLMAYVPGAVVATANPAQILPDWANNRFYTAYDQTGGLSTPGMTQYTGYVSGDVTLEKTAAAIGITYLTADPMCLSYNGNLVFPEFQGSNSTVISEVRAADFSFITKFGTYSADLSPSDGSRIRACAGLAPLRYGRTDFVIATNLSNTSGGEVCLLGLPGLTNVNLGNCTEVGTATVGPGLVGATVGTAFVLGRAATPHPTQCALYSVTVPGAGLVKLATYLPATIDATWTHFSAINGVGYDHTDGHVLIAVQTDDAVATVNYLVKLNSSTGAIIWKCAFNYNPNYMDQALRNSSIKNGRLYLFGDTVLGVGWNLYRFDTIAGTATIEVVSRLSQVNGQASEDTNDSVVVNGNWVESATHPNYIGTYMGTLGNHTYAGWMRYFPFGPTPPLPPAPPPLPSNPPIVSVNRAWSYTLDGHTFYVLDLGAQGTFAYDQVTNQWSEFVTGAPSTTGGANLQWNFQNGCMWGTRVVAGDLATSTVWEMAPAAVLDNDATQIAHVCTGAVPARSRTYITCDALRVSASFGFLDSTGAVNFNLRFSDDQEATWSPTYSVALTPGNFGSEIAWRSLGAFASPGRIFELSDTGGLIRIDGADVYLDGFDDKPAGAGNGQP